MASRKYCVLNVVAHPHPKDIYKSLFMAAAESEAVNYRADHYARVSPVTSSDDGVFRGRLAIWTELDPGEPTINKISFEQKLLSDSDIALPRNIGFNSKIFYFSFKASTHRLFVELKNNEGQTISAGIARLAFERILKSIENTLETDVKVYISTLNSGVERILNLPSIRKIHIRLDLPNPDDLSDDEERVLEKIKKRKVKRFEESMTKLADADTIVLSDEDKTVVRLSKDNGFTRVEGRNASGDKVSLNTADYPDIRTMELDTNDSSFNQLKAIALRDGDD